MRTGLALMMIAAAMATAWVGANALHTEPAVAGIDTETTTASIPRATGQTFMLTSPQAGETCLIVKGESLSPGYAELKVNPACERLLRGVSNARFWRERADGSIAFSADARGPIVEFAAGDGVEYESYAPASVLLKLKSQ